MINDELTDAGRVGARIKELREALGFSGAAFARLIGVSAQNLSEWERGNNRPQIDQSRKICAATGATHDWIYEGNDRFMPYELMTKISKRRGLKAPDVRRGA